MLKNGEILINVIEYILDNFLFGGSERFKSIIYLMKDENVYKKVVDLKIKEYYKYIPIVKDIFIF